MAIPGPGFQYGIKGGQEVVLEKIVRPFETPKTWPTPKRTPPIVEDQEALLVWHATLRLETTSLEALSYEDPLKDFRDREKGEEDEEELDPTFYETTRRTSVVRVVNPEDPSSWVDVERVEAITFQSQLEGNRTYVFRNRREQWPPVEYV